MNPLTMDPSQPSSFRAAVESKDIERVISTLAPDVRFRSPVAFAPYEGRDSVGGLLRLVGQVLGPNLEYQWQVRQGDREVLCFKSRIGSREIEGVDLLRYDDEGRVAELVVMVRPASALLVLGETMAEQLKAASGNPEVA